MFLTVTNGKDLIIHKSCLKALWALCSLAMCQVMFHYSTSSREHAQTLKHPKAQLVVICNPPFLYVLKSLYGSDFSKVGAKTHFLG